MWIAFVCAEFMEKHTAVSHNSTEAETMSLDAGLRMEGIPAMNLWDTFINILHPKLGTAPSLFIKLRSYIGSHNASCVTHPLDSDLLYDRTNQDPMIQIQASAKQNPCHCSGPEHQAGSDSKREDLCQHDSEKVTKTTTRASSSGHLETPGASSSGRPGATEDL